MSSFGIITIWSIVDYAVSLTCASRNACEGPCVGMKKFTMFRGASESLQPVILGSHLAPADPDVTVADDWIAQAQTISYDRMLGRGRLGFGLLFSYPYCSPQLSNPKRHLEKHGIRYSAAFV